MFNNTYTYRQIILHINIFEMFSYSIHSFKKLNNTYIINGQIIINIFEMLSYSIHSFKNITTILQYSTINIFEIFIQRSYNHLKKHKFLLHKNICTQVIRTIIFCICQLKKID
jgi:hypothetical protein